MANMTPAEEKAFMEFHGLSYEESSVDTVKRAFPDLPADYVLYLNKLSNP